MTTALRRIEDLIQGGLAARVPDPRTAAARTSN
jgi:hypothetical protein